MFHMVSGKSKGGLYWGAAVVFVMSVASVAQAEVFSGTVKVIDGDTFDVGTRRVRLQGIDAPEKAEQCEAKGRLWSCGAAVTAEVRGLYDGVHARCAFVEYDKYGRHVAFCDVAGQDVGAQLVRDGLAIAYRKYSLAYVKEEAQARAQTRGIWGEAFRPIGFRDGCKIKGNLSSRGAIYHMPGTRAYKMTKIDPARGEQIFCTEAEARAAGWRPVRG